MQLEKTLYSLIDKIDNISGKDILADAVKEKLDKSLSTYDKETNIDIEDEDLMQLLKILTRK